MAQSDTDIDTCAEIMIADPVTVPATVDPATGRLEGVLACYGLLARLSRA